MTSKDTRIARVEAFPSSFPVKQGPTLGIGRAVKRDLVVVKITTEGGLVGWGEAHHGRCPGAVGQIVNTTLRQLVTGMDATDVVGTWARIYQRQLGSHGMGAATALAMSGIDQALWDIRGKAVGWPLYRLLGGASKPIRRTRAESRSVTRRLRRSSTKRAHSSRRAIGRSSSASATPPTGTSSGSRRSARRSRRSR